MSDVFTFVSSLIDNSVLLLVLLPLVGAGLVQLLAVTGRETIYFTALANVWLSAALGGAMLLHFDSESRHEPYLQPQMVSSLRWLSGIEVQFEERVMAQSASAADPQVSTPDGARVTQRIPVLRMTGPDVRFVTGVNALSVWFVALIVAVTLVAVRSVPFDSPRLASRMSTLLATESCLIGSFVAQDVLLLSFFWILSSICLCLLIGTSGELECRVAARRFLSQQIVSGLLLTSGVAGLAVACWWMQMTADAQTPPLSFSLNRISGAIPAIIELSDESREYWQTASPWLFVLVLVAAALRTGIPPFHHGWYRVCASSDRSTVALASVGFVTSGYYLIARLVIPTFPVLSSEIGSRMFLWGIFAALFLAVSTMSAARPTSESEVAPTRPSDRQWRRVIAAAVLISLCLATAVLFIAVPVERSIVLRLQTELLALRGSLLLAIGVTTSAALAILMDHSPEKAAGTVNHNSLSRASAGQPADLLAWPPQSLDVVGWATQAGLSLMPLGGAFWGILLLLLSVFRRDTFGGIVIMVTLACLAMAIRRVRPGNRASVTTTAEHELPSLVALLPLLAILVLTLVQPDFVAVTPSTEAAEPSVTESSGSNSSSRRISSSRRSSISRRSSSSSSIVD